MAEAADNQPNSTNYGVFGVGNALLDVSAQVHQETLDQFGLQPANAILAEGTKYDGLFKILHEDAEVKYISGGATMNAVRIANWMLQGQKPCSLCAILGKDKEGEKFQQGCKDEKLETSFFEHETVGTGRCAVCIVNKDRSMVADLKCNNEFPITKEGETDFLFETSKGLWDNADIVYISGFWLTVNPGGMKRMGEICSPLDKKTKFMTNISAPFLASVFTKQMTEVFPYVDVLFGNESEAEALAKALNLKAEADGKYNLQTCAKAFAKLLDPEDKRGARCVITQGGDAVLVAHANGDIAAYPVPELKQEDIVDLNGAGDGFTGGFMAGVVMGKNEKTCVAYGSYAAQFIIKTSGVQFGGNKPEYPADSE